METKDYIGLGLTIVLGVLIANIASEFVGDKLFKKA